MTSGSNVWWEQLSRSRALLDDLKRCLVAGRSIRMTAPDGFPWRQTFFEKVNRHACREIASKSFLTLMDDKSESVAERLLSLCTDETRNGFWPGESAGHFLAQSRDSHLSNSIVWIYGVTGQNRQDSWQSTLGEYLQSVPDGEAHAVFILEYGKGDSSEENQIWKNLRYEVTDIDRYIFCLSAVSEMDCHHAIRQYTAELMYHIGGKNPEDCGALARYCDMLAARPAEAVALALPYVHEARLQSAVWNAQARIFFPAMEVFRMRYIQKYRDIIVPLLPVDNGFGCKIENPFDLDVGNLSSLQNRLTVKSEDRYDLSVIHSVRNAVAHNKVADYKLFYQVITKI